MTEYFLTFAYIPITAVIYGVYGYILDFDTLV